MEKTLQLMKNFEKRNNLSIALSVCSDGSFTLEEFWDNEILKGGANEKELHNFLKNTQYKLAEDGRCFSPVQLIDE